MAFKVRFNIACYSSYNTRKTLLLFLGAVNGLTSITSLHVPSYPFRPSQLAES